MRRCKRESRPFASAHPRQANDIVPARRVAGALNCDAPARQSSLHYVRYMVTHARVENTHVRGERVVFVESRSLRSGRRPLRRGYMSVSFGHIDTNTNLFARVRRRGTGHGIRGEIQSASRPQVGARLGPCKCKKSCKCREFGAKGRFFDPISRPTPFDSSRRDDSNGLGPSVGSNFGHGRLVSGRRQWVTSTRLSIARSHR